MNRKRKEKLKVKYMGLCENILEIKPKERVWNVNEAERKQDKNERKKIIKKVYFHKNIKKENRLNIKPKGVRQKKER